MADSNPHSFSALLIVISAPSGGGKTTLCDRLLADCSNTVRAVTCTTRDPRAGEEDGIDYYFLDAGSFLKRVQAGHFLEHATVHGNSYGTLKSEVLVKLRQEKDVLLSVDVQGAAAIRQRAQDDPELKRALVTIFLAPESMSVLEQRLKRRGKDSSAIIQKRLAGARQEISQWKHYDYIIVSGTPEEDLRRTQAIIEAEKMKPHRVRMPQYD